MSPWSDIVKFFLVSLNFERVAGLDMDDSGINCPAVIQKICNPQVCMLIFCVVLKSFFISESILAPATHKEG